MRKLLLVFITLSFSVYGLSQNLPHILLTNDDGIDAPGLLAMYQALSQVGTVTVAAPATAQSLSSHGLTSGRNPIFVTTRTDEGGSVWHSITARPATCVSLALESLLADRPDIVVSGSNNGANLGLVSYYSGTVAAAREAAFQGIPSIAVSVQASSHMDFEAAAEFTAQLVGRYLEETLPPKTFLNVNCPALEINPDFRLAWNRMGYAYVVMGQYQEAAVAFQRDEILGGASQEEVAGLSDAAAFR